LIVALLLAVVGTVITWRQRDGKVEIWSVGLQLTVLLWVLFNLLMISMTAKQWVLLWYQLFFPCAALLVVVTMGFVVQFTGRGEQLTRRRLGLLFSYPAAVFLVSITNRFHGLLLVDPTMETSGSFAVLNVEFGPVVYVSFLIGYGIIAVYASLLILQIRRSRNVYRRLSFVLLMMVLVMSLVTVPRFLGVSPFPYWIFFVIAYLVVGVGTMVTTTSITAARMIPVDRILAAISSRSGNVVPLARDVILQEADNGILVLDTEARVVDINRTAKTMLGTEHPVGRPLSEITQEELVRDSGAIHSILWGEESLRELRDQVWVETNRGERCYDTRVTELTDATGSPAGFVVLLHDITEQKQSERQLEQQRNELQTQKQQLEHQNERLDQFAGIVSHDLRNPLNVAHGHVEIPQMEADDEDETVEVELDRLETIRSAHERMEDIIDDALTLAREGKAITETESVMLAAAVEDAWDNVETADASLEVPGNGELEADRDRLLTVFENLIRNSLDHGRSGSEPLTIRVGTLPDGSGIYIEDDGGGIPADQREEIFEHGHTTSADGTGLGLSIVRDILRGHGWTIDATESSDGGARFEVTTVSIQPQDDAPDAEQTHSENSAQS
jgi:PAS domain S-box-containing protein